MTPQQIWIDELISRPCPLCTGLSHQTISSKMQHGLDLPTVICLTCGFVFTNPVPPHPIYERFYVEAYAQFYGHITPRPLGALLDKPLPHIQKWLDHIRSVRPLAQCRLLEIGPGQGLFLWWASQQGCEVMGLEPSPEFQVVLREANLPYVAGTLETADVEELGKFDVIAMFHVLEHFYDPNSALEKCHALLKPDGILVVEVPNILKPFRSLDHFFLRYVHPSNFSPSTLQRMLAKHQFETLLMDEGGAAWSTPQNLFGLTRRVETINRELSIPTQPVNEVLSHLAAYRRRWRLLQWRWAIHLTYYSLRRSFFRMARRIKRWLFR